MKKENNNFSFLLSAGMCLGLMIGAVLGEVFNNLPLFSGIGCIGGVTIGVVIAVLLKKRKK